MSRAWVWRGLLAGALPAALMMNGCAQQPPAPPPPAPPRAPANAPTATPAPAPSETPAATPTPAAPAATGEEKGKVTESEAVKMARKLGTATKGKLVTEPSGLMVIDVKVGKGEPAKAGDTVAMQYTGWLEDGTKFDSSKDHGGQPYAFPLGAGRVIKGWDLGVAGMKPGGVRKLIIPSDLGYGAGGRPPVIPPNATLIFQVEYVGKQ